MNQFAAFINKEFLHVFRDKKTLLLLFGMPIAQILLFGFALTNEIKNSRIAVLDNSKDNVTHHITRILGAGNQFIVERTLSSPKEIEAAFRTGNIKLAVVFPSQFERSLLHSNQAAVQVIADGSDPNTATALTNYVRNIIAGYNQELIGKSISPLRIIPEVRMLYNPSLKGATNFVPGVMALVLMLVCVLMTSVSVVREKELGTMEVLLVSPFHPFLVIVAKAVPYFALSLVNLCVILILSVTLLDMPVNGSVLLLFAESGLLIFTALSLGLFISNSTTSQQTAMLLSLMGMMLPTMMFTGFMFPIENMPKPLQVISNIVPTKWYYIIVKAIMIKGLGFSAIWKETLILFGIMSFFLLMSYRKFKIRLA